MEHGIEVHSFYSMIWIRQIINCTDMNSLFSWRYGPGLIRAHTVERRGEKGTKLQGMVCWCLVNDLHCLFALYVTSWCYDIPLHSCSFLAVFKFPHSSSEEGKFLSAHLKSPFSTCSLSRILWHKWFGSVTIYQIKIWKINNYQSGANAFVSILLHYFSMAR